MAENKVQDYTEDKNEGHVDTREANFECETVQPLACQTTGFFIAYHSSAKGP